MIAAHRARHAWLVWLLVVCTALPAVIAASNAPAPPTAFSFAQAQLTGEVTHTARSLTEFFVPGGLGNFSWTLAAPSLIVNWTRDDWAELGRPTNVSEPFLMTMLASSSGEDVFGPVRVSSSGLASNANLAVRAPSGQTLELEASVFDTRILIPSDGHRTVGAVDDYRPMEVTYVVDDQAVLGLTSEGHVVVTGSLSIYVWSAEILVQGPDKEQGYRSGAWVEGVGPTPSKHSPLVRERHYQLLRLDAPAGTLTFHTQGREISLVSRELTSEGNATATFQMVEGNVRSGTNASVLPARVLTIDGPLEFETRQAPGQEDRLFARLQVISNGAGVPAAARHNVDADAAIPQRFTGSVTQLSAGLVAVAGVALAAAAAILASRRLRTPHIEDVEWALLAGRPRKAKRLGRRLVARNPSDADALFLYGAALLAMKNEALLLRHIEPLAHEIPNDRRSGIAYCVMMAARSQGDIFLARVWAAQAAQDPVLRARMERDGTFAKIGLPESVLPGYG